MRACSQPLGVFVGCVLQPKGRLDMRLTAPKGAFGSAFNSSPQRGVCLCVLQLQRERLVGCLTTPKGALGTAARKGAFGCDSHPMGAFGVVYKQATRVRLAV
ncbi:hypothetical protein Tco_0796740 [Tanacetum coccineum]